MIFLGETYIKVYVLRIIFMFFKIICLIVFNFLRIFQKKISHFLKKYDQNSTASTAKFCYMISFFGNFPSTLNTLSLMENCEKCAILLQVACGSGAI